MAQGSFFRDGLKGVAGGRRVVEAAAMGRCGELGSAQIYKPASNHTIRTRKNPLVEGLMGDSGRQRETVGMVVSWPA